jgi:hypothetical protein
MRAERLATLAPASGTTSSLRLAFWTVITAMEPPSQEAERGLVEP